MTKLQGSMLFVTLLCLALAGATHVVKVPPQVRDLSVGALAAVCFMAALVFLFGSIGRKN